MWTHLKVVCTNAVKSWAGLIHTVKGRRGKQMWKAGINCLNILGKVINNLPQCRCLSVWWLMLLLVASLDGLREERKHSGEIFKKSLSSSFPLSFLLATVDDASKHTICRWEWQTNKQRDLCMIHVRLHVTTSQQQLEMFFNLRSFSRATF